MQLLLNAETERELAAGLPSANAPEVADHHLESVGAWMTERAIAAVEAAGIEWSRGGRQTVGAFVIVQRAEESERDVWDAAIAACRNEADARLRKIASN